MRNDTPPTPPLGKERAESALRERGWELGGFRHPEGVELAVGRSTDYRYEACLWEAPMPTGASWLCSVSAPPSEGDEASLWLLGIPRPKEVPALLQRHADILTIGPGWHTVDLKTGGVLDPEETRRKIGRPLRDGRAGERGTMGAQADEVRDKAKRIEKERAWLREEAEALRERCGTDNHPMDEETRKFGEKVAAFARAEVLLDLRSKCPRCNFRFEGACYAVVYEDGERWTLCDCCVAPNVAGATFEDHSGRRGRVEYVELGEDE